MIDRPLGTYLDKEMTDILVANNLKEKGMNIKTGVNIKAFTGDGKVAPSKQTVARSKQI